MTTPVTLTETPPAGVDETRMRWRRERAAREAERISTRDLLFGDLSGMHDCPQFSTATARIICGCAPGECQQAEAERHELRVIGSLDGVVGT